MKRMNNNFRICLVLYYYCGFSVEEISNIVERNTDVVNLYLTGGEKMMECFMSTKQMIEVIKNL